MGHNPVSVSKKEPNAIVACYCIYAAAAAQTAEETRRMAAEVHGTLQDQGDQIDRINHDIDYVRLLLKPTPS